MGKKTIVIAGTVIAVLISAVAGWTAWKNYNELPNQVARLKLERNGYTLGLPLSKEQLKIAMANPKEAAVPGTFKFLDNNLFIVAQQGTNRVLVIYEQIQQASQKQVQDLIGDLYIDFEDPTVSSHQKVIFWVYSKEGKITSQAYDAAKEANKKLNILATVKCVSDVQFMGETKQPKTGMVYYVISSEALLAEYKDREPA